MFGLTEEEMDLYRDFAQDYAVMSLAPKIKSNSQFITPVTVQDSDRVPDLEFLRQLLTDIETVITITTTNMAYEYAHLQCEMELSEDEIVQHLHNKYQDYLIKNFIKYGIAFTEDVIKEIVGEIILELPYLYMSAIQDESFDEDEFLEKRMYAYNDYLNENFLMDEDEDD